MINLRDIQLICIFIMLVIIDVILCTIRNDIKVQNVLIKEQTELLMNK